jgi:phosphoglycolate phosphatase
MTADASRRPAILFDLDGTLTDSRPGIVNSTLYALRRFNETRGYNFPIPQPEALTFIVGPPLRQSFAKLVGPDNADTLLALYRERYEPVGMLENSVYPDIVSGLEALDAMDFRLYVATSKPEHYARRILDHFGLSRLFIDIHGAASDGTGAGKAEIIAHAIKRHTIDPANAAMIGDREHDALGARANGLRAAVGALWGYGSRDELRAAGADPLLNAPIELELALRKLFFSGQTETTAPRSPSSHIEL